MILGNIHHLGYLVKDIDKSIDTFKTLGYKPETDYYWDSVRLCKICFMIRCNEKLELIEPDTASDIYPLLSIYNNMIYHVCYVVDNLDQAVDYLKSKGFLLFKDKQKAPAISKNASVVFLKHARIGIIELVQEGT